MNGSDPLAQQFLDAGMDTPCQHEFGAGVRCELCGEYRRLKDALIAEGIGPADIWPEPDTSAWDAECEAADKGFDLAEYVNGKFDRGEW